MHATLDLLLRGETLHLDADRALFWPRARTLIVADVHLGKGSALRRGGVAVPAGSTRRDLDRLTTLVARHAPHRLLVLGDLFHAALAADESWFAGVAHFVAQHPDLRIEVVRGNHDRIDGVPREWRLLWHQDALIEPPFVWMHDAAPHPAGYAIGGHLHPAVVLRGLRDKLRLPVFWLRGHHGVLPSFGSFTGGWEIEREAGDRAIAVTPQALLELPARH